jgi:hypothetical protein
MPKKEMDEEFSPKTFQRYVDQLEQLKSENKEIRSKLDVEIKLVKGLLAQNQERIEETINTQEEIIMDMIKKFNDEFMQHKIAILKDLEVIKNSQDVLKISYSINENKILEKIKSTVYEEVNQKLYGRENEILMKLWIDDFKEILSNFDKLKKLNPKEFSIQLKEISDIIESFKQKMEIV